MTLGPQFEQLKLFMTANEIKGYVNNSMELAHPAWDFLYKDEPSMTFPRNMEQLWDVKLEHSKKPYDPHVLGSGVYDGISSGKDLFKDNYDNDDSPVYIELDDLGNRTMINHHHRVAAQADIESKAMDNWRPPHRLPQQKLIPIRYIDPGENPRNNDNEQW